MYSTTTRAAASAGENECTVFQGIETAACPRGSGILPQPIEANAPANRGLKYLKRRLLDRRRINVRMYASSNRGLRFVFDEHVLHVLVPLGENACPAGGGL